MANKLMKTINTLNRYSLLHRIGTRTALSAYFFAKNFARTGLSALLCLAALSLRAQPETNSAATPTPKASANPPSETAAAPALESSDTNLVTMNFHGAPLDQVHRDKVGITRF